MVRKTKTITIELEEEIDIDLHDYVKVELKDNITLKGNIINEYKNSLFKLSPEIYFRNKDCTKVDWRMYFSNLNHLLVNISPYNKICIDLSNYKLNNDTFTFILGTLAREEVFERVVEINIENNKIQENGFKELLIFAEKCPKIELINLDGEKITFTKK